ncbi:MAG TPA: VOC family protein [Acidimicrobiales bacterium]|jgi:catechol 2,3-dioxygenase-like lactoylglutathione lyase family enzyme|nr:VOC family protein [Acidimicrobiales bacterium]
MVAKVTPGGCDVGIVVRNGPRALALYQGALGLEMEYQVPLPDGGVLYRLLCGGSVLKIFAPLHPPGPAPRRQTDLPFATLADLVEGCTRSLGYCYIALTVPNLTEVYAACMGLGCRPVFALAPSRPGTELAVIEDLDGNWVELVGHPDAELADADLASKDLRNR